MTAIANNVSRPGRSGAQYVESLVSGTVPIPRETSVPSPAAFYFAPPPYPPPIPAQGYFYLHRRSESSKSALRSKYYAKARGWLAKTTRDACQGASALLTLIKKKVNLIPLRRLSLTGEKGIALSASQLRSLTGRIADVVRRQIDQTSREPYKAFLIVGLMVGLLTIPMLLMASPLIWGPVAVTSAVQFLLANLLKNKKLVV